MDGTTNLFTRSTSRLAGERAAASISSRRGKILSILQDRGPSTMFEVANLLHVNDHQLSGRFTELARDGLIERSGQRRPKPETGCEADVWRLREHPAERDLGELLGYPPTLLIQDQPFDRQPVPAAEHLPGVAYARRAEAGGMQLVNRVDLIECPGCGRPPKRIVEPVPGGRPSVVFRCGTTGCQSTWRMMIVREPGGAEIAALVMESM